MGLTVKPQLGWPGLLVVRAAKPQEAALSVHVKRMVCHGEGSRFKHGEIQERCTGRGCLLWPAGHPDNK